MVAGGLVAAGRSLGGQVVLHLQKSEWTMNNDYTFAFLLTVLAFGGLLVCSLHRSYFGATFDLVIFKYLVPTRVYTAKQSRLADETPTRRGPWTLEGPERQGTAQWCLQQVSKLKRLPRRKPKRPCNV